MTPAANRWLIDNLFLLARFQFAPGAVRALRDGRIEPMPWVRAVATRGPAIVIPDDVPAPFEIRDNWTVPFNGTEVTLWHRLPAPGPEWAALPDEQVPLWWRHPTGTLLPAWNVWAVLGDLLGFRDDREIAARDGHGRLPAEDTPRHRRGLLDVPAVNEANAILLDAALSLGAGAAPRRSLPAGAVTPPGVALSHDCDQLRGNDFYTQGVRAYRLGRAAVSLRARSSWRNARGLIENALRPRRYYFGNMLGMLDLERQFGFRSVSYMLNGAGGRFGARSGSAIAREYLRGLVPGWEAGMHYNHDTFGDAVRFEAQKRELQPLVDGGIVSGRAHYLRFDPLVSPAFVAGHGIRLDESLGWAERLAYRGGIAGPFRPMDPDGTRPLDLLELPLVFTDTPLIEARAAGRFERMFGHLQRIGGMATILFHPGVFDNPEQPEADGLYFEILRAARQAGSRSWTPGEILAVADESP